jgi:hypothetical protein
VAQRRCCMPVSGELGLLWWAIARSLGKKGLSGAAGPDCSDEGPAFVQRAMRVMGRAGEALVAPGWRRHTAVPWTRV